MMAHAASVSQPIPHPAFAVALYAGPAWMRPGDEYGDLLRRIAEGQDRAAFAEPVRSISRRA